MNSYLVNVIDNDKILVSFSNNDDSKHMYAIKMTLSPFIFETSSLKRISIYYNSRYVPRSKKFKYLIINLSILIAYIIASDKYLTLWDTEITPLMILNYRMY